MQPQIRTHVFLKSNPQIQVGPSGVFCHLVTEEPPCPPLRSVYPPAKPPHGRSGEIMIGPSGSVRSHQNGRLGAGGLIGRAIPAQRWPMSRPSLVGFRGRSSATGLCLFRRNVFSQRCTDY